MHTYSLVVKELATGTVHTLSIEARSAGSALTAVRAIFGEAIAVVVSS